MVEGRLAVDFFVVRFLAGDFLATVDFVVVLLAAEERVVFFAVVFLAGVFFVAVFLVVVDFFAGVATRAS
ncbi:MAG: hypothetical protein M3Z50_14755 [Actinomycetota bacterium]|nr:hypothetical protein [Actinomycetota bacterium]